AQQKRDAAAALLDGRSLPESGAWASKARRAAETRLRDMGLPSKRDEYWRYTDPKRLIAAEAQVAALHIAEDETPAFDGIDQLKLVFVDGVFDAEASDPIELDGVEICQLADAARSDLHWARDVYGALDARAQMPVARPLASLNTAYATEGVLIRVTGKPAKPIALIYQRRDASADA
ncbi:hypothetical protein ACFFRS_27580, partial [Saccharopolyspora hordei]|uniref:hypothetical protein n=1 Tax=Saccharopolyspora hordei TaxID=1838 RepID=UPI0035EE0083